MANRSTISIPRLGSGDQRVLRLRAQDGLREMVRRSDGTNGAGEFVVPSRERLVVGQEVLVEVSFGAMSDEVFLAGIVTSIEPRPGGAAPLLTLHVPQGHAMRMDYVVDVLDGRRSPTARRHRRVDVPMPIRWWWGIRAHGNTASALSVGGAFIAANQAPQPGFRTEIEIRTDSKVAPMRIPSTVIWADTQGPRPGFGVQFKIQDAGVARSLGDLMREMERVASKEVISLSHR